MCLFVMSRKEEPNLVIKTVSAAFQSTNIRTMFISNPDDVSIFCCRPSFSSII